MRLLPQPILALVLALVLIAASRERLRVLGDRCGMV